jgi:hypothetical protein
MVGGPAATFEKAKVVLEPMAKAVILAGESGAGQYELSGLPKGVPVVARVAVKTTLGR